MSHHSSPVRETGIIGYSIASSFQACGERYRLERDTGLPPSPTYWATLAGSVIHEVTAEYDTAAASGEPPLRPVLIAQFHDRLSQLASACRDSGQVVLASGRRLKAAGEAGGPNKKDEAWWRSYGPIRLARYIDWREGPGAVWQVATLPDGQLGVEVEMIKPLSSELSVRGTADRVFRRPDWPEGHVAVFDIKTGGVPDTTLQLATYGWLVREVYDLNPMEGFMWSPTGRQDTPYPLGRPVGLDRYPYGQVKEYYLTVGGQMWSGEYIPVSSSLCRACPVREYCWMQRGGDASPAPLKLIGD